MERTVGLALKDFPTTPNSLRKVPHIDEAANGFNVNLTDLYFHYYQDKHGKKPPNPDPSLFEHLQYFASAQEFRLLGDGLGVSTNSRRTLSNELGQAFCRLFLHDHLGVPYFAHIDRVLRRSIKPGFGDLSITRNVGGGDAPDYFCAKSVDKVFLAEAKGSHDAISFESKMFQRWRNQFNNVVVQRPKGNVLSVKGYIVATRYATESRPFTKSVLYAEDPATPGELALDGEASTPLGSVIVGLHYAQLAQKLNQPILAEALEIGFPIPQEILVQTIVWELGIGPLAGKRFVGGYYPSSEGAPNISVEDGKISYIEPNPLRLDIRHATFIGIEENIFGQVVAFARGQGRADSVSHFDQAQFFYSAISILLDGSIIGPVEFFRPITNRTF